MTDNTGIDSKTPAVPAWFFSLCLINFVEATQMSYWPQLYSENAGSADQLNSFISYFTIGIDIIFIIVSYKNISRNFLLTLYWPIIAIIAILVSSTITSDNQFEAARVTIKLTVQFITVYFLVKANGAAFSTSLYRFAIIFAALNLSYILLLPSIAIENTNSIRLGTWRGMLPSKNDLGLYSAILLLYHYGYIRANSKKYSYINLIFTSILVALTIGSQSISAWIGLVVAIPATYFVNIVRLSANARVIVLAAFVPSATLLALVNAEAILGLFGRDVGGTGRLSMWAYFWRDLLEKPISGYGFGAYFADAERLGLARYALGFEQFSTAHNTFLEWGLAAGFPGLLLSLVVCTQALLFSSNITRKAGWTPECAYFGSIVIVFAGFLTSSFGAVAGMTWIIVFAVIVARENTMMQRKHMHSANMVRNAHSFEQNRM